MEPEIKPEKKVILEKNPQEESLQQNPQEESVQEESVQQDSTLDNTSDNVSDNTLKDKKFSRLLVIIPLAALILLTIIIVIVNVVNRKPSHGIVNTSSGKFYISEDGQYKCKLGYAVLYRNGEQCKAKVKWEKKTVKDEEDGEYLKDVFTIYHFCSIEKVEFSTFEDYLMTGQNLNKAAFDSGLSGATIVVNNCPLPKGYIDNSISSERIMGYSAKGADYFTNLNVKVEKYENDGIVAFEFEIVINAAGNITTYKGFAAVEMSEEQ